MKTILVVDDDYALVSVITALLEHEGYRVVAADNGNRGLARLRAERPDLVLTDFMMPGAGGADLVHGLRDTPTMRSMPIVMMSSMAPCAALPELALHTMAFLQKPFRCEQLLEQVVALIGQP